MMLRAKFGSGSKNEQRANCPIVAELELPEGMNLTKNRLEAVECLLISRLQPLATCNASLHPGSATTRHEGGVSWQSLATVEEDVQR